MSESQMQPGWYYAQGDAPGTQRYWDGTQWVGDPQVVGQPQDGSVAVAQGGVEFGPRAIAWIIDTWPWWLTTIVNLLVSSQTLAFILALLAFVYIVVSKGVLMGQSGQSIGKKAQGLKLVSDKTGQPIGVGLALARLFVSWLFILPCLVPYILDHLWPLWDPEKKRLLDKIFSTRVVQA